MCLRLLAGLHLCMVDFTHFAFVYGCRLQVGSITSADKNKKDFVISITVTEAEVGSSRTPLVLQGMLLCYKQQYF